ncbi:MAG: CPBP family intramembrane metalloprotease [Clostridia bacterium]|nr:CPBP family intramembrane metalloprotease [Clostridia bacterium]
MKNFLQKYLPVTKMEEDARLGRKGFRIGIEILIFLAVFYVSNMAQSIPLTIVTVISMFKSESFMEMIEQAGSGSVDVTFDSTSDLITEIMGGLMLPSLFFTAFTIVAVIVYCRYIEKRPIRSLGFRKGHIAAEYLVGIVIGAAIFSLAVGICVLTGALDVTSASRGSLLLVPVFFVGFMIQGMSEELLCRGYLMLSISRRNSRVWAIFWSSLIFMALHVFNPGLTPLAFVNLFLFGVFAAVYFLKRGNIWGVGAIHSVWNFMQGNFYGIPVSGMGDLPSVFTSGGVDGRSAFWTGGAFGLEGGFAVTLVLLAATAVMLFLVPTKKSELAPVPEEVPSSEENAEPAPETHLE